MTQDPAASPPGRSSHTEWAVRRLRAAITEGELLPHDPLRANVLAKEWGISPTPIREAFQRLASDGFVVYTSHRGVRVAPTTVEELEELLDLRLVVEPLALRRSMEAGDPDWIGEVESALVALQAAHRAKPFDFPVYEEAHHDFHAALASRAGPTWWPHIATLLLDQTARYRALNIEQRDLAEVMAEHEQIVESCIEGDVDGASDRLARHVAGSRQIYTRLHLST